MNELLPMNLEEAVIFGLNFLNDRSKLELAKIALVDPHTTYGVDYIEIIGSGLGISSMENQPLLSDIAVNHSELLHFLETDGATVEPDAAIRVILTAMSKTASTRIATGQV